MSATGLDAVDGAPSPKQVEELVKQCDAMTRALTSARATRRFLVLALLVFVVAVGVMFYGMVRTTTSKENVDVLLLSVQDRLSKRSDEYMREVQTLVSTSSPVLTEAVYKQSEKDLPLFLQDLEREREIFRNNMEVKLTKVLAAHYDAMIKKHEATLLKELPETEDPKVRARIVANLHVVFERLVKTYYIDELNAKLTSLFNTWDRFPAVDAPGPNDPNLEQQLIATLLDAVSHRLATASTLPTEDGSPLSVPRSVGLLRDPTTVETSDAKKDAKPEEKADTKADVAATTKAEEKPGAKTDVKPDEKPENKPEDKPKQEL